MERLLGADRQPIAVARRYAMPPPGTRWEAIRQGQNVTEEERRRLGFGNASLPDLVDVLETQCVVLISLTHVSRLHICRELAGYDFVVPDHVREKIVRKDQRAMLDQAVAEGTFRIASITDPARSACSPS